ncbi:MAG: DMT family transporter [Helicobacter sp.]|nr:DMT family transporter [Helicobacter sp.]
MPSNQKSAIFAILAAAILFTAMGVFVRLLSPTLPIMEITFFRNFISAVIICASLFYNPPQAQIGGKPFVLFLRGFCGGSAMLAYFYNISTLSLGTAYAFSYTSPIFLAFFSVIFLHKKVSLRVWVAIFLGFSGILLISNPSGEGLSLIGFLIGIYSGIGAALAYFSITKLANLYDPRIIILSLALNGSALCVLTQFVPHSLFAIPLFEAFVLPSFKEIFLLLGLGLVSNYAQIFLTKAYTIGDPPTIGAISYSTILFATLAGILLGDAIPSYCVFLGIFLIIGGGVLAAFAKR